MHRSGRTLTKEPYFTAQTLDHQARQMREEVQNLRKGDLPKLDCKRAALLVLDMQRYFLEESAHAYIPSATAIIPKVKELINEFYRKDLPIIFTRHLNTPEDAGQMGRWWRALLTPQDPLSAIIPELQSQAGTVIEKSQYDAFYKTSLEKLLRGVHQVVICGVMTHLCCETTARAAFVRGFEVFFTIDGTATYNERFHRATLLNAAHGFACPVLVAELLAALRREEDVR